MTPVLITPPINPAVTLADMRAYLRVTSTAEDPLITSLVASATGHFDGWKGVLGRCIMPQTWAVTVSCAGSVVLPMPDVVSATADYGSGAVSLALSVSEVGTSVEVTAPCTISFVCAMGEQQLSSVRMAIMLLVGHWFTNREAVGGSETELPLAVSAVVSAMRWGLF